MVNVVTQMQDSPLDEVIHAETPKIEDWNTNIASMVQQEIVKFLKGKSVLDPNCPSFSGFAGR